MKKFVSMLLSVLLVLSLVSCGSSDVTAESLLEGVKAKDGPYISMRLGMTTVSHDGGEETIFDVLADYEISGGVTHISNMVGLMSTGDVSFDMGGEIWQNAEYTYSNMSVFGQSTGWLREPGTGKEETSVGVIDGLVNSDTEAVLEPHTKGEDYVVSWVLNMDEVNHAFGALAGTTGMDTVSEDVKIYADFDEETKELKSLRTGMNGSGTNQAMDSLDVKILFNEIGTDKTLEIPEEIVNADFTDPNDFGFSVDKNYVGDSELVGGDAE